MANLVPAAWTWTAMVDEIGALLAVSFIATAGIAFFALRNAPWVVRQLFRMIKATR